MEFVTKPFRSHLQRGPLANAPNGDFDLLPVAVIAWVGSVARVVAGRLEKFQGGEATLAFLCMVLIPSWALWLWVQTRNSNEAEQPDNGRTGIFTKS